MESVPLEHELPGFRPDAPICLRWCLRAEDRRWMDVYNCERFHISACHNKASRVFEIPAHHEIEAQIWCVDNTANKWGSFPFRHIRFFFESEADAMLFKLRFSEHDLIDLETNELR